jgi:hypothetical protein
MPQTIKAVKCPLCGIETLNLADHMERFTGTLTHAATACEACGVKKRDGKKIYCKDCYARKVAGCSVVRRQLVTHSTLSLATGEINDTGRKEWRTQACGTPLFSKEEVAAGKCSSCRSGWTHDENYAVDADGNRIDG